MNILFYFDPCFGKFDHKAYYIEFCTNIIEILNKSQLSKDFNYYFIVDEEFDKTIDNSKFSYNKVIFSKEEVAKSESNCKIISDKFAEYEPDIVISCVPSPVFNKIFPNSLILDTNFLCSKPPFQLTISYDPIGKYYFGKSFLNEYKDEINQISLTQEQKLLINNFKTEYQNFISEQSPYTELIQEYRKNFSQLALLALHGGDYIKTFNNNNIILSKQLDYIKYVMDNVPSDIGVIVTMHPHSHVINDDSIESLRNTYSNFLYHEDFNEYVNSSQFLLAHVDVIINTYSAIGYQALLWDRKLIDLSEICLELISDSDSIANIKEVLKNPVINKDNLLYWFILKYAIHKKYFDDPEWHANFFIRSLKKFRDKGINADFYDDIDKFENLITNLINSLDRNILVLHPDGKKYREHIENELQNRTKWALSLAEELKKRDETISSLQSQLDNLLISKARLEEELKQVNYSKN